MIDELVKKRIDFHFGGLKLKFDLSQSLFSSADIDIGTKALMNSLRKNKGIKFGRILDLGCGYGVIGVFLKKQHPESSVFCSDRDALAVEFAKRNSLLNECEVECLGSLDYSAFEDERFDLIVCNFPAKAGKKALKKFLFNASLHLNDSGVFAGVVVKELADEFKEVLEDAGEKIEVVYREDKAGYVVFHLKYSSEIKFDEEVYTRNKFDYKVDEAKYKFRTAFDIPEFESPSFASLCAKELLKKCAGVERACVFNPGQGFLALFVEHYLKPKELTLASRDLLALKYSLDNLNGNGFENVNTQFSYFPEELSGDLLVFAVDEDESVEVLREQLKRFSNGFSSIVLCSKSRLLKEVLKGSNLRVSAESNLGKYSGLLLNCRK